MRLSTLRRVMSRALVACAGLFYPVAQDHRGTWLSVGDRVRFIHADGLTDAKPGDEFTIAEVLEGGEIRAEG